MIQLVSKELPPDVQAQLTALQRRVDDEPTFEAKAKKAQDLWESKGGKKGKEAFEKIVQTLQTMCVYVRICNYCEQSEASDVEHIYPKSLYPEYAFQWDNYLLACKQCNSGYKLDTFFVLDATENAVELVRGTEPPHKTLAFINPRTENPHNWMILNTSTFTFDLLPDLSKRDVNKAIKTLDVLQLNVRDTLLTARKSAARYYYQRMLLLVDIVNATTKNQLFQLLTPYDALLDQQQSLAELQEELKTSFKKDITTYQHPSVWHAIKIVASKTSPKWKAIFDQLPEALHW